MYEQDEFQVLSGHMKFPIIPRRIVISKRLAQCMHPALPAGLTFLVSGSIFFRVSPDIRPAGYKIITHIPEPFQCVENKSEIAIRNVSRFLMLKSF